MRRRLFGLATALTLLAVIGIVVLNGPAQAAPGDPGTNFYAYLNGNTEVPATASNTTGMATFHVNGDGTMSYTLTVYNILNPFMGHIHLGAPGVAGPVVVDLIPMGAPKSGAQNIITSGTITSASLSGPLKGQPLSVLINQMAYNAYVNIHTSDGSMTPGIGNYPGGEIRGNIISADANRIGTQPAVPAMVNVATGVVPFPYPPTYAPAPVAPAVGSQPVSPITAPGISSTSPNANPSSAGGQAASNPALTGGSTSGAASGAPTTGGSGSTTSNPTGGGGGSAGTGAAGGPLGAGAAISSGGTTGATSGSSTSSTSGSGTGGAGTIGHP